MLLKWGTLLLVKNKNQEAVVGVANKIEIPQRMLGTSTRFKFRLNKNQLSKKVRWHE